MKCPQCRKPIEVRITNDPDEEDYVEIETACEDDHIHFARIREEDLIQC